MLETPSTNNQKTPLNRAWLGLALLGVLIMGLLSRLLNFESPLLNNYLGDALYAVMVYLLTSLVWPAAPSRYRAGGTLILVWAIEIFQLTPIPAQLRLSENIFLRVLSFALGTTFGWADMVAYTLGVLLVGGVEYVWRRGSR
jgi:hypothetical protein